MKQKTLLLFQLLMAVFAFYAVLNYSGNTRLLVPLSCLAGMFVVSKVETAIMDRGKQEKAATEEDIQQEAEKSAFNPLDCLLHSKNVLLLIDAIHYLLQDLGLPVSRSPEHPAIDRLLRMPEKQVTFGLKIIGDVAELTETWDKWDELADYELGKGGKRRLLIIGGSCARESDAKEQASKNFPVNAQKLLASKRVVAMTNLTLYKVYLLCKKKNLDPKMIFGLIHRHPGGVFELEQYKKRSTQAA